MPHNTIRVLLLAGAVGIAAGCTSPQPATTATTPTPQAPSATTSAAPAGPTVFTNPKWAEVMMRRGVVATHCDRPFSNHTPKESPAIVRLADNITAAHEFPVPTVAGTKDALMADGCATSGSGDDFRLTYAVVSFTPSSGLEPESREVSLVSYRLNQTTPVRKATVWKGREQPQNVTLRGSDSGVAVSFNIRDNDDSQQVRGYSGVDLKQLWTISGSEVLASTRSSYAVRAPGECGVCPRRLSVVSAATGTVKYEAPPAGDMVGPSLDTVTDHGYGFGYPDGMAWFDESTAQPADPATGALRHARALLPDPTTNLIAVKYTIGSQPMYKVLDRTTWADVFVIDTDRTSGMDIDSVALYDGHLYIQNSSDDPVVRIADNTVVARGWQVIPVGRVATTTVLAHAPSALGSSNCVKDTLVRETRNHPGVPNVYGYTTCQEYTAVPDVNGEFPGPRF